MIIKYVNKNMHKRPLVKRKTNKDAPEQFLRILNKKFKKLKNFETLKRFIYQKKTTKSGKLIVKIFKIPFVIKVEHPKINKTRFLLYNIPIISIKDFGIIKKVFFFIFSKYVISPELRTPIYINDALNNTGKYPTKIFFDLSYGGGTDSYFQILKEKLIVNNQIIRIQYFENINFYCLTRYKATDKFTYLTKKFNCLRQILTTIKYDEIIINHLIGFPHLEMVLQTIKNMKKDGVKISMRMHDFYSICPHYTLMRYDRFCNGIELSKCQKCFPSNNLHPLPYGIDKKMTISNWRAMWNNFYQTTVDEIIVFSESSLEIIKKAYPQLDNIKLIPHFVPEIRKARIKPHKGINIGILGSISSLAKGMKIVSEIEQELQ